MLGDITRGSAPHVALLLLGTLLMILFPSLSLWLPGQMPK